MRLSCKICFRIFVACGLIVLAFTIPARAISLPIKGEVQNSAETFTGKATAFLSGDGSLILATNTGVTCYGDFVHVSSHAGTGTVLCTDGRLGIFNFVTTGLFTGSGNGKIGLEDFIFHIGK
jgi:hypothetical protein